MGKNISPHVNIYKFPVTALSSITTRLTGLYLSGLFIAGGIYQFTDQKETLYDRYMNCLLYTSPSPRDGLLSRMPSSA